LVPTGISVVLEPLTLGASFCPEPPSLPLLQALSTEVDAAATPVAMRKFLREKDMLPALKWE
jgi:hypothetical protein